MYTKLAFDNYVYVVHCAIVMLLLDVTCIGISNANRLSID